MMESATLIDASLTAALLLAAGLVQSVGGKTGDVALQRAGRFLTIGGCTLALVSVGAWQSSSAGQVAAAALLLMAFAVLLPARRVSSVHAELAESENRR